MNKKTNFGTMLAVLLTGTNGVVMTSLIIPIMAYIAQAYPEDPTKVSLLMTLPTLIMIPSILVTGKLAEYIGKKELCIVGTLLYAVGGVAGGMAGDINVMLAWRALMGVGGGILFVVPNALVGQLYEGKQRADVMGYMSTAQSVLQIAVGMLAGVLGVINWRYCFYGYGVFFLFLLLQLLFIPKLPPDKAPKMEAGAAAQADEKLGGHIWLIAVLVFAVFTTGSVYNLNVSAFVVEGGFGTSVEAGIATTVMAVATILVTALFGKLFAKLKVWFPVVVITAEIIAYGLGVIAPNIFAAYFASMVFGILPAIVPYVMTRSTMVTPLSKRTMGMSLLGNAIFFGQFASTPFLGFISNTFGPGYLTSFQVTIVVCLVMLVIAAAYIGINQKKLTEGWDEKMAAAVKPPEPGADGVK